MADGDRLVDEALYTDAWVRRYLGVDRRTLATWRSQGRINALRLSGRCLRYRGSDVRQFLEVARRAGGAA
jgi:excisionase family DNA binding protein